MDIPKEEALWVQYIQDDVVKYIITSNLYRTEYYLYKTTNNKTKKTKYKSNDPQELEKYIKFESRRCL